MSISLGQCEVCGHFAETQFVTLRQQIGALIVRFEKKVEGRLCKACIDRYFWQFTPVTALLGWWGVISDFVTPIYLVTNLGTFIRSRKLTPVPPVLGVLATQQGMGPMPVPGYEPQAHLTVNAPVPQLLSLRDDRTGNTVSLVEGVTFGRSAQKAQIVIDDPRVSGLHARVLRDGNTLILEDTGSSNGILIDGRPSSRSPLMSGMRVQLGDTRFTVLPHA